MNAEKFGDLLSHLRDDAEAAIWNVASMRAILDEPVVREKLAQSYSGHAMEVANIAVKRQLALYCCRAWDRGKGTVSIPKVFDELEKLASCRNGRGSAPIRICISMTTSSSRRAEGCFGQNLLASGTVPFTSGCAFTGTNGWRTGCLSAGSGRNWK